MATLDEILGPSPKQGKSPTLDEILGPSPENARAPGGDMPMTGPEIDAYLKNSPVGKIIHAFGEGFGGERVGLSSQTESALKSAGILPDYEKGQGGLVRAFNDAVIRPAAVGLDAAMRAGSGAFRSVQEAVSLTGEPFGPGAARLTRDIAAAPEAFMGAPHPLGVPDLAKARDLGVIGEGEAGYFGMADETAARHEAIRRLSPSQDEVVPRETEAPAASEAQPGVPAAETPPDIHAVARQVAPETFREYDALAQRKQTFARWIDELAATRDQAATADLDRQIAQTKAKLEDASGKRAATYRDRLADLNNQREQALDEANKDTPDMARVRQQLQQTDYRMRDLAPDVSAAYRQARETMPRETPPEAPPAPEDAAGAPVEAPTPAEPPAAPEPIETPPAAPLPPAEAGVPSGLTPAPVDIAADVAGKLTAAGRAADEASAAAAIVQAHYEARAQRLGTTAHELYSKEGPAIDASATGRKGETGRTIVKDGRATIRLMRTADASTFLHETGHQWLEELTRDAKDERATPDLKQDAQTVRDYLGNDGGEITRAQHEKFARSFERYLMEGRAPTQALAGVFAKFKDWLTTIYQTVQKLRAPITDDIRDVFDRLIAKEPDQRGPVVAPEREAELGLGERHEALAEATPPEKSDSVADQVRAEADAEAKAKVPEIQNDIRGGHEDEARGNPPARAEPHGDRTAAEPHTGETGGGEASGTLGTRRGEAPPEGAATRPAARVSRTPFEKVPREPQRLLAFLRVAGGIKDESGEISTAIGGVTKRPGLINNKNGLTLDDAALRAWEHGFIGTKGGERPSINDLLEAVDHDARGNPRYSAEDHDAVEAYRTALNRNAEIDRLAKHYDIDHRKMTREEFFAKLSERASFEGRAREIDSQTAAHEAALEEAEARAAESRGDAFESPPEGDTVPPRTLKDLDNERRQEEAAGRQGSGAGTAIAPRPGGQGASEAGDRQRGRGAGPLGPHDTLDPAESRLVDKAGNIRLDNLNTPEDVSQVIREAAERNEGFAGARRGVISDAQVLDLADALGMDPKELSRRKLGQAFNAEQIVAARKLLIQSAVSVRDIAAKVEGGTDADLSAYAEARARHLMIQEQVHGITAEAGRALRAFREIEGAGDAKVLGELLQESTGKTLFQLRREAKAAAALDTSAKVSKFVRDSEKPGFGDMVLEYWINGLISGPATHTTYAVGNALLALWKAGPETAGAAAIGALRRALGDEGPRVSAGEVPAQLYGMIKGVRQGVVAAWESAKTGQTTLLPGELETMTERQRALSPMTNPKGAIPNFTVAGVPLPLGTLVRLPSRGVAIIHSFFRAMNYEREMTGLAYRTAADEGLSFLQDPSKFAERVGEVTQNPSADMMKEARASATDLTLMGKGGELTQALSKLTNAKVLGFRWLKFVDPFVHISSNVIEQAVLQRTPAGILAPEIRDNLMGRNGKVAQDMAIARMAVGSALGVAIGSLAAEGLINGSGPSDPKQKAISTMVNGPPHSARIGDTWYDIHRLGPLGMLVGIAADLYEVAHVAEKGDMINAASLLSHAFTQNILDESFMRGPSDLIRALTDREHYGAAYVRNFLSSFTPYSVGSGQIARAVDPYSRQARTVVDTIKAKIPWLSETLLPRRDVFGEPIPNKEALGVAGLSAIYEQKVNNGPVPKAMLELGVFPGMPHGSIRGVKLTDRQYDDLARIGGRMMKMRLDQIVGMPGFGALPDIARREMIEGAIKGSRETAASLVLMQNPEIIAEATKVKLDRLQGHAK